MLLQILDEELRYSLFHVDPILQPTRRVTLLWEEKKVVMLFVLDKRIDKPSCVPKVHIFIDEAMHKHEATHDGFAVCHYRSIVVACRIRIWCAHVTLSIMCICVP